MLHLALIHIHPFKSLDPVSVNEARFSPAGGLDGDRQFALFDTSGKFVNGKRHPRIHQLRARFDWRSRTLRLFDRDWNIDLDRPQLEDLLAAHFGVPVSIRENPNGGFPDDTASPGPTVISTATLQTAADWFGLSLEQMRLRMRANLEISGVEPFWEDRLFGPKPARVRFQIGDVILEGNNPCRRCIVPTRDPFTGEDTPGFKATFLQKREQQTPPWADRTWFDHFYRLAVNTVVPPSEAGKTLRVGDNITILNT
jgi:uncharacterized protein YcbX